MTAEAQQIANDPSFAVEFAIGDPFPQLVPQDPRSGDGIRLNGVYFDAPKRYVMKKAHFSAEDRRIFDADTGLVVLVSSHVGKNPYESVDPLGFNEAATGEWKSITDVHRVNGDFPSFKIRPKKLSRHGTQYVDLHGDGDGVVLNVAKMSKLRSKSVRPHHIVGRGKDAGKGSKMVYKLTADIVGRTLAIENSKGELVAQMAKTTKALLKTAVFGSGSESTIDIAPGEDCSTILAVVFALGQVGQHYVKDTFHNFVVDPLQDNAVEAVGNSLMGQEGGVGSFVGGMNDNVEGAADAVGLGGAYDAAEGLAGDVGDHAADFADDVGLADAAEGVGDKLEDAVDFASSAVGDLGDFFSSVFGHDD